MSASVPVDARAQNKLELYDMKSRTIVKYMRCRSMNPADHVSLEISRDGRWAVLTPEDGGVEVVSLQRYASERVIEGHGVLSAIHYVDISHDSQLVATASSDCTVRIWNLLTGAMLAVLQHDSSVRTVAFFPEGSRLATITYDGMVHVWEWYGLVQAQTNLLVAVPGLPPWWKLFNPPYGGDGDHLIATKVIELATGRRPGAGNGRT